MKSSDHDADKATIAALEAADRRRMAHNLAAFVFILAFVCLDAWLIDRLATYSRNLSCMQAHHRNCG